MRRTCLISEGFLARTRVAGKGGQAPVKLPGPH